MNWNKATDSDGIMTEILSAFDDFSIKKITDVINEIYNSGDIPEDLTKSIFITLPKRSVVQMNASFMGQSV